MTIFVLVTLNWTFVGPEGGDITSVSMEGEKALAASFKLAYYSNDSASTWNRIDLSQYAPLTGFLTGFETGILSGRFFVFHSEGYIFSDDGANWTPVDFPNVRYVGEASGSFLPFIAGNTLYLIPSTDYDPVSILIPSGDTLLIAVGSYDSLWYAFARSISDSVIVYRGILDTVEIVGAFGLTGTINDVEVNPMDPDEVLLATSSGIYTSTDGGVTFSQDISSLLSGILVVTDLQFIGGDTLMAGSFYFSGAYVGTRSFLGWTFEQIYSNGIITDISGNLLATLGAGVLYRTNNYTLEERNEGLYAHFIYNPGMISNARDDRLSFINAGGRAFYSTDGGTTWNSFGFKMDIGTVVEVTPYDPQIVFIGGFRGSGTLSDPSATLLAKSTDGGSSFDILRDTSIGVAFNLLPMEIQTGSDANDVFMVSGQPGNWLMEYSSDGGLTFQTVKTSTAYNGFCFSCMDTLFLIVDGGSVFMSVDAGATWDSIATIGYPGDVYITYRDGYLYYSTGLDGFLRFIDTGDGTIDSIDLSFLFDSLGQVQVSVNGHFFLTGYQGNQYIIAYGSTFDHLTTEVAPTFGGLVPMSNYVYLFSPHDGGFYVSAYPTNRREYATAFRIRYTATGILVEGVDGPIEVFDARGRLVKILETNRLSRTSLPAGVYILKTQKGSARVILR